MMGRLALIGVPTSVGARRTGQERGPAALRAAGLLEGLWAHGLDVADLGDLPTAPFRPDHDGAGARDLDVLMDVVRETADRVHEAITDGRLPLVLGGDCTVSLGVLSGLLRTHERPHLLYFDADLDLNTPDTTVSGAFDGMVLAHALGRGAPELAGIGPRTPLLSEGDISLFGYDVASGWIDPPELEILEHSRMAKHPLARVRADPEAAAKGALHEIGEETDGTLVHFDIDVTSLSAVDVPHPGGLDPVSAFTALEVFVRTPLCRAVVVTELNPDLDSDGSQSRRVAHGLVDAFRP